jgi:hypothetical protein
MIPGFEIVFDGCADILIVIDDQNSHGRLGSRYGQRDLLAKDGISIFKCGFWICFRALSFLRG